MNKFLSSRFALSTAAAVALSAGFVSHTGTSHGAEADSAGFFQMRVVASEPPATGELTGSAPREEPLIPVLLPIKDGDAAVDHDGTTPVAKPTYLPRGRVTGWF
jgi:hypothetical protein